MMRLSSLADYAVVMMAATARHGSTARLAAAGLLESARGQGGGFGLARAADTISLADIVEAVEGPIALTSCVDDGRHDCALESACRVKPHWAVVNGAVRQAFAAVSLASLAAADEEVMA